MSQEIIKNTETQDLYMPFSCELKNPLDRSFEALHIIKDQLLPVPPLFEMIQKESGTSGREMYQVFNMGHRLEFYVPETIAEKIIAIAQTFHVEAQIVGRVEAADHKKVTLDTPYGLFEY